MIVRYQSLVFAALCGLLLVALVAGPVAALGVTVSSDHGARDLTPHVAESPDGSWLVATWTAWDMDRDYRDVRIAVSRDGGASWLPEQVIHPGQSRVYLSDLRAVVDSAGRAHVFFMMGLGEGRSIYHMYTVGDPAQAGSWRQGRLVCSNCVNPDVVADGDGNVYVLYQSNEPFMGLSKVQGANVVAERRITLGGQRIRGALARTPDGKLHIAYGYVSEGQYYYARYTSFDQFNREVHAEFARTETGSRPIDIAADVNGKVHLTWMDQHIGYYREVVNGDIWPPVQISAGGVSPVGLTIAADGASNVAIAFKTASAKVLYEARRIDGVWRQATPITPRNGFAEEPQYGVSQRGSINLVFSERAAEHGNAIVVRFLGPVIGRPGAAPAPEPVSAPAPEPAPIPDPNDPDRRYFPESGRTIAYGFKVFWETQGGLETFGFPWSDEIVENGRTVQYFERARFEYFPELAGTDYTVQLGRLGAEVAAASGQDQSPAFTPAPDATETEGCQLFPTGHQVCGGFLAYYRAHGFELGEPGVSLRESVARFGYPLSSEMTDPATGRTVQWFERARFEWHPDNPEPHRVLLGRIGAEVLAAR